ncbi:MAG: ABC transporter substrate-binding protein [Proteobacteria bacterium]|nr:ABC transporter substrate-binding protein [Pseudomonadota bacterium]
MRPIVAILALSIWVANSALAQDAGNPPLVGVLRSNSTDNIAGASFSTNYRNALAALGYEIGRNLRLDVRLAEGHVERFPALADALVRNGVNVIVTFGEPATRAAQRATSTIPIVAMADDLVGAGLIASLARPGGNTTGVSLLSIELDAKRIEILKQILPAGRRFGLLNDPNTSLPTGLRALAETARIVGVELQTADVHGPADFPAAFAAFRAGGVEAVNMLSSPMLTNFRQELGELILRYKLPTICQFSEMAVEAGCLASYGFRVPDAHALVAAFTIKMLKGARADETPAQQPAKLELVVNLKTARALGIEVPLAILIRADEVIE